MFIRFPKMHESESSLRPIGVFDSGIGGLTVVRALRDLLPNEDIFYIGDTARLPYGGKSKSTIERYSIEISGLLLAENAKMIVVACNTSSSLAISKLQEILKVPVVGVIAPGARAAVKETRIGHVGVIGTKSTIQSEAYERAIHGAEPCCARDQPGLSSTGAAGGRGLVAGGSNPGSTSSLPRSGDRARGSTRWFWAARITHC